MLSINRYECHQTKIHWGFFSFLGSNQGSSVDLLSMDSLKNENKGPKNYEYQGVQQKM